MNRYLIGAEGHATEALIRIDTTTEKEAIKIAKRYIAQQENSPTYAYVRCTLFDTMKLDNP